jgi:FAD:protein FMN transferase
VSRTPEASASFDCFGSSCAVFVSGLARERSALQAVEMSRNALESWHARFSRFLEHSELSALNADPRETVPVSALMARLVGAVVFAGSLSGGLVDATLVDEIARAGYSRDASELGEPIALRDALALAPPRKPARAARLQGWAAFEVDARAATVKRPPGTMLDSGGIAKGLFADVLAERLADHASFAVVCAGDLAVGGADTPARAVHVESPFDGSTLHTFELERGGVATSGIGRRSWHGAGGAPSHHLLDPASGRPAFTGVVQTTALAPSSLEAEVRAKAALLSGPSAAREWLAHGGLVVFDDGSHDVIEKAAEPRSRSTGRLRGRLPPAAAAVR